MIDINMIVRMEEENRQTGRTTALVEAAKKVPNSVFVTHNLHFAEHIKKEFDIETCSINNLSNLIGRDVVLFYDHTIPMILAQDSNQKKEVYNSVEELIQSILEHNSRYLITDDLNFVVEGKPMLLQLGWRCLESNTCWFIHISKLKKYIATNNTKLATFIRNSINNQEGKHKLANALATLGRKQIID